MGPAFHSMGTPSAQAFDAVLEAGKAIEDKPSPQCIRPGPKQDLMPSARGPVMDPVPASQVQDPGRTSRSQEPSSGILGGAAYDAIGGFKHSASMIGRLCFSCAAACLRPSKDAYRDPASTPPFLPLTTSGAHTHSPLHESRDFGGHSLYTQDTQEQNLDSTVTLRPSSTTPHSQPNLVLRSAQPPFT